jgi:hypothetical protein
VVVRFHVVVAYGESMHIVGHDRRPASALQRVALDASHRARVDEGPKVSVPLEGVAHDVDGVHTFVQMQPH